MSARERVALACVCAVGFAFSANYTNHAPVVPALVAEFHFSQVLAGLLTTGIFLTHAAMQVPGGHLADRLGPMRVLSAAMAVVTIGNFGIGFSASYWQLLCWKIFVGVGTGTSFVAGARYIAHMFAGPRLHVAQGLYGGSILLGSGFVIFAVPQFLAAFGWRGAFFATATVAALVLVAWMLAAPLCPAGKPAAGTFGEMLADGRLWLLGLVQMASFGLVIVVGSWIALLLRTTIGLSPARAGLAGSLVLLLGIVTRPLGGWLARRAGMRPILVTSLLASATGCFLLGAPTPTLGAALAAIALLGIGCGLPYASLFNRAAAMYPARAGAAMGLVNMLGIVMILAGAPLVGQLADWSGNFRSSFVALGAFTLVACAAALGIRESHPSLSL
jgi:nitrate/nitrite transporter NarK